MKSAQNLISWEESVRWLKAQPEQAELVRTCFYDDPLSGAANRYYAGAEWTAIKRLIGSPRGRALDIGSGRGISAYALAKDGWQTTALEPDASAEVGAGAIRQLATETGASINVVEEWGERLPFESDFFDLVHCRQLLHHARDLQLLCREAGRVLKAGGVFIATREHVLSRKEDLQAFLHGHPLHHLYGGENAYLLEEYTSAISAAGIKIMKVLNPLETDINRFPFSKVEVKASVARRLFIPHAALVPDWLLSMQGRAIETPGRLYSFLGRKKVSHA